MVGTNNHMGGSLKTWACVLNEVRNITASGARQMVLNKPSTA